MICSLLLMNRFSTAQTSQEQGHNIIFNSSCSLSEQASEIVAVLSCTLYTMLRGAVMCSVQRINFQKIFFVVRVVKLAQAAQRGGRCPIPGNIQGQVEQGSERPGLVQDAPAHCRLSAGYQQAISCGLSACETIRCYKDEKIYLRHTNLKHSSHFTEDKETVRIENVV